MTCGEREKAAETHTPEPWYYWNEGGNLRVMAADENGRYTLADMCCDDQKANARRIVACVNACKGIPTEALEDGTARAERDALREMTGGTFWEIKKQRDELLAELLRVKDICLREVGIGIVNEVVIARVKAAA